MDVLGPLKEKKRKNVEVQEKAHKYTYIRASQLGLVVAVELQSAV